MKNRKAYRSFQEYLTHKGKVLTKPPVEDTPDYKGPKPKAPAKAATKGKGWEVPNTGKKGTPGAYKNGTDKAPKKAEKGGFGDMGDKALVYEPADEIHGGKGTVSKSEQGVPGGKKDKTWPKTGTTEAFLSATKDMTTAQFAKHIKKGLNEHCGCENKKAPHVVAYSVGAYHPDPIQAIRYVTYLANENANLRTALVREANRCGCTASLLEELLQLPESYTALAQLLDGEKGESFNRRLRKAIRENREELLKKAKLHEDVDEPAHDDDTDINDLDKTELDDDDDENKDDDDDLGDDDMDGPDMNADDDTDEPDGPDMDAGDGPPPDADMGDGGPHDDTAGPPSNPDMDDDGPPSNPDMDDEDGPPAPPPDEAGKIDFKDDDLGDEDDMDDMGDDDEDDEDHDDDLGDDLDKDHPVKDDDDDDVPFTHKHHSKKMPWDED